MSLAFSIVPCCFVFWTMWHCLKMFKIYGEYVVMDLYCGFEKNCNDLYQHRIRTHSVVVVKLWCNVILFFNMGGIRGLLMMTCGQQQNCKMNYIDISSHSQAIRFHQYILELVYLPFDPYSLYVHAFIS